jgi:alpha-galactosidase
MQFKVAFIGAGSITFTRNLVRDLLVVPSFRDIEISFMDISEKNLDMVTSLVQRDIDANGLNIHIQATMDRKEALAGARYVFNVVRIGGLEAFAMDVDIPLKYGVDQCVGDTLCVGGIMYGQRGIAFMLDLCRDIREVAEPGSLLLNYANPNAMMTWAAIKYGGVKCVGLCHGVQHGHHQIAEVLGAEQKDVDIICAGINHQTWYMQVKLRGQSVPMERILKGLEEHPEYSVQEKVRIDMMKRFGYYSTESNGHLSEYLAWYRKRPNEIPQWISTDSWINGETGGYLRDCIENRRWFETEFPHWMEEPPLIFDAETRSQEHGSHIVEGLETGRVYRGHFNLMNNGCITNLPDECIVEVPGYVDYNGFSIPKVGNLPLGCAAVISSSIWVQRLAVEAAVSGDDRLLRQAMMIDPLVGAVCNPPEIWQMVDELLTAEEQWLPQYSKAISEAKACRAMGNLLPTRDGYRGSVRFPVEGTCCEAVPYRPARW